MPYLEEAPVKLTISLVFLGFLGFAAWHATPVRADSFCDYACAIGDEPTQGPPWKLAECSQAITCEGVYACAEDLCGSWLPGFYCSETGSEWGGPAATWQCYG